MKKCFVVVFFAVLTMNLLVNAQTANPASDFEYDLNEAGTGVVIKKYNGETKDVIIPSVIEDFPVVELGNYSFAQSDIISVVIPDSVVYIGGAFAACASLAKVTLPKGHGNQVLPKRCNKWYGFMRERSIMPFNANFDCVSRLFIRTMFSANLCSIFRFCCMFLL